MSNLLDYNRMSNFVTGVVDRKFVAIGQSLTTSTGYLAGLISSAQAYVQQTLIYSTLAGESATEADGASSAAQTVYNAFTSTYVGLYPTDPVRSSLNNVILSGAIYIRESDGRLRYTNSVDSYNNPIWADATVSADASSILSAGTGVFLTLGQMSLQTVKGPVTFQGTLLGPAVTNWTTRQLTTALDVNGLVTAVSASLTAEVTRATGAEQTLNTNKVSKTGDIMSSTLSIVSTGETASLIARNTDSGGKAWRISSATDGRLRFIDDTSAVERMAIGTTGVVSMPAGLTVTAPASLFDLTVNRTDSNDSGVTVQSNSVTRWVMKRSVSASRFYLGRYNGSGVYIDSPFYINESDGSITQNTTSINGSLNTSGAIQINTPGALIQLNNSSGVNNTGMSIQHLGINRWFIGRSAANSALYINRLSNTGVFQDTPLQINETTGLTTVSGLTSNTTVTASESVTAPMLVSTVNGTGRGIKLGDDAWIGDGAIINGFTIRGQQDFNAGYISFGNSGRTLGTASGSTVLTYNGSTVWHAGNHGAGSGLDADLFDGFDSSQFVRVIASSSSETGGYRVYSDGYKECWGKILVLQNAQNQTYPFPASVEFTTYSNVVLSGANAGTDAQDNLPAVRATSTTGFTVNNAADQNITCWYQAKGY